MAAKKCLICNCSFSGRRDAKTCSARCRKRLQMVRLTMVAGSRDGRLSKRVAALSLAIVGILFILIGPSSPSANAATSSYLNFQARLLNSSGQVVPDGTYNIEFKIDNNPSSSDGGTGVCSGSCLWRETRDYNGGSPDNRVRVVDGYLTVNLGSVTSFASTINWDQPLYLTMNIGGTGTSASWDGAMSPRITLTALPYAFRAGTLAKTDGSGNVGTLSFNTVTNNPVIQLPDASGTVCLQSASACGFAPGTSSSYIQNGVSVQTSANFYIDGSGKADTSFLAPSFDAESSNGALGLGNSSAGAITIGNTTNSTVTVKTKSSTSAFQVQNSNSRNLLAIDSANSIVQIGNTTDGSNLTLSASGNTSATIRKNMAVSGTIAANDVVVIDTSADGTVTRTTTANDNKVFGIATGSGTPQDIVVGGTYQVNLLATNQAITRGDFLVTTTTGGRVDKASGTPATGTVVGRALENKLSSAGGTIWAYITPGFGGTGTASTLAQTYAAGASQADSTITLDSTRLGVIIKDANSAISGSLFIVQDNGGSNKFLDVRSNGFDLLGAGNSTVTTNSGNLTLDSTSASTPTINIGTGAQAKNIQIGTTSTNTGNTQTIGIGNLNAAGTTNITIGTGSSATAGDTTLQAKGNLILGNTITPTIKIQGSSGGSINIGDNAVNKTISIGASGTTNNTTTIHIGDTTSTGGAQTLTIGGTGANNGSNTSTTVKVQAGQTYFGLANAGATLQTFTNSSTAFQIQNASSFQVLNVDTTTDSANLVTNGSFEVDTSGWTAKNGSGTSTPTQVTTQQYIGTGSMQIATTGLNATNAGASYSLSLTNNTTYTLSFFAKLNSGTFSTFQIGHSNNNSTDTSDCDANTVVTSGWTKYLCSFTYTGSTGTSYVYFKQTDSFNRTWFVDGVKLESGSSATPYKEGNISFEGSFIQPANFRNQSDSTNAFGIQNASGGTLFKVDTLNTAIVIGTGDGATPGAITVRGAAASGSNIAGANITFDASNGTGAAGSGDFIFRTGPASGGVTFDQANSTNDGAGGATHSFTWSGAVIVSSGHSNNILVVGIGVTAGAQTVATVTYNGASMTQLTTKACPTNACRSDLWYLVNPTADGAAHNLVATLSGAVGNTTNWQMGYASYYNVDQTTPLMTATTNSGTTVGVQTVSNTITPSNNDQVPLDLITADQALTMIGSSQVQRYLNTSASSVASSNSTITGSVSMQWSMNSGNWGWIGTALNPASNSATDTLTDRLHITASGNVGIGTSAPSALLQVAGSALFNTTSTSAFQIQDASGNPVLVVDNSSAVAKITIGPISTSNPVILVLGNKSNSTADPAVTAGAIYYNSSSRSFRCGVLTVWVSCVGGLLSSNTSASSAITNTTTETNFSLNYSMVANYCTAGRTIRWTAQGVYSTDASAHTMVFRVKAGSTALATSPTITPSTGLSNREWRIEAQTICNAAPGGSAATETQGILTLFSGTGTSINYELVNTATTNLATNGALTMQISMQWGTGVTASDTITMRQFIIEGMGP